VVEVAGLMALLPAASTVPTPPSIVTAVAFVVFQVMVDDWPRSMVEGDADRSMVGAACEVAVGGAASVRLAAGGGVTFFFEQLAPKTAIATRRTPRTADL
jgi:hypothetical protein